MSSLKTNLYLHDQNMSLNIMVAHRYQLALCMQVLLNCEGSSKAMK